MNLAMTMPLIFLLQFQTPANPSTAPKAAIEGSVVRAATGEPIPRAQITITRVAGPGNPFEAFDPNNPPDPAAIAQMQQMRAPIRPATTDERGKFQIKDLEPGSYRLYAARNGFTRQEYGQRSVNRPGTILNIRASQVAQDIVFRMTPAGTISGRVFDSYGEPLPGVTVQAQHSKYDATGKRTLQTAATAKTNDLGEYRLYWMNPGRYFLSASSARSAIEAISFGLSQEIAMQVDSPGTAEMFSPAAAMFGPGPNSNEVADSGFVVTYYPGTPDISRAAAVDLQGGAEIRSVDFTLLRDQRFSIRGRVVNAATGRPPQFANVTVSPRNQSGAGSPLDAFAAMGGPGNQYNPITGAFEVRDVAPGSYLLQVMAEGGSPPRPGGAGPQGQENATGEAAAFEGAMNTTSVPVDVGGSDVDNINVTLSPGFAVPGRIRMDGPQIVNPTEWSHVSVALAAGGATSFMSIMMMGGQPATPAADGTFSIPRVTPGEYRLVVNGMGPNMYIKDARLAGSDVLEAGVTIADRVNGSLEITLGQNAGEINGTLADGSLKPVSGVRVVLIPDRFRDRHDLYKTAITDQDGRFTIRAITPGEYRVFGWEDIEPFSYFDADVLKQYEDKGKRVRIGEGAREQLQITIIPAAP